MKNLILKPGAIILWREYNKLQKFWAKLRNKQLPYNKSVIIPHRMDLVSFSGNLLCRVFEPRKQYSNSEKTLLNEILDKRFKHKSEIDYLSVVNIIRPETFDLSTLTLDEITTNKYYREVYAKEC